jgi:hypothetical protein
LLAGLQRRTAGYQIGLTIGANSRGFHRHQRNHDRG